MTGSWQEWIVVLLVLVCIIRIAYSIFVFFRKVKNNDNPCANCASGCELKRQLDKKREECRKIEKTSKKKCCR